MGADIYLDSIWKPFEKTFDPERTTSEAWGSLRLSTEMLDCVDFERVATEVYDAMRASGGYFRNGYNSGDIMWAMGLSWGGTVAPMLDAEGRLPIDRARDLVAMIEARPLTRERVARHIFEHMSDGRLEHPLGIQKMLDEALNEPPRLPPDFDHLFAFLSKRREELLSILHKSIELDEPLLCQL